MLSGIGVSYTVRYCYCNIAVQLIHRYEQIGCFCSILQLILIQSYNCLRFPLVVMVSNSYYTRFYVYINTQKFYFYRENIIENEYFIISLLHSITVFKILDGIRNQYNYITGILLNTTYYL